MILLSDQIERISKSLETIGVLISALFCGFFVAELNTPLFKLSPPKFDIVFWRLISCSIFILFYYLTYQQFSRQKLLSNSQIIVTSLIAFTLANITVFAAARFYWGCDFTHLLNARMITANFILLLIFNLLALLPLLLLWLGGVFVKKLFGRASLS